MRPIRITGSGCYLPEKVYSSEIERKFGLAQGWSQRYSGVEVRHQAAWESGGYMGAKAIEAALAQAKLPLSELDMIIAAGATFDYPLPSQSAVIKSQLAQGAHSHTATIDVDSTCLSFISAFEIAAKLLDGKQYKNIAIVSSEIASKGLSPTRPETLTLFGDAAAAFILSFDETKPSGFIKAGLKTYSQGVNYTIIKGGGNQYFFKDFAYDQELHAFEMDGMKLLKMGKEKIPSFMEWFFEDLSQKITDIPVIIPHQASQTALHLFKKMYDFAPNQLQQNLATHGNCIAASIPLLLHQTIAAGTLKRGDLCLLCGTSAGFSIGAALFQY